MNWPTPDALTCSHCGAAIAGQYCSHCGQKRVTARLKLGNLLVEIPQRLFNWEQGWLGTVLAMVLRPGQVCLDYVQGRRKNYLNPFSYFLLGATCQLLAYWLLEDKLRELITESLKGANQNPGMAQNLEALGRRLGGDGIEIITNIYLSVIVQAYTYLALLGMILPLSVCLWLGHRLLGQAYHLAELLVFGLYVFGHCLIVTSISTLILTRLGSSWQTLGALTIYVTVVLQAHRTFFQPGWLPRLVTIASLGIAIGCFFVSILSLFAVSLLLRIWLYAS